MPPPSRLWLLFFLCWSRRLRRQIEVLRRRRRQLPFDLSVSRQYVILVGAVDAPTIRNVEHLEILRCDERFQRCQTFFDVTIHHLGHLRQMLAEGRQPSKEMQRRAADVGIKERTLARARAQLGVLARSDRGADGRQFVGWFWELPR